MKLKTRLQRFGAVLVLLIVVWLAACEPSPSNDTNNSTSNAESSSPTETKVNSNQELRNTNQQVKGVNKQIEEIFAESPPLNTPECIALESNTIERQRKENLPDEQIKRNIFALRNMIRTASKDDPAKQAAGCKNLLEMQQKFSRQTPP